MLFYSTKKHYLSPMIILNHISRLSYLLNLCFLLLIGCSLQAQTALDSIQLEKIGLRIDSLSKLGQAQAEQKDYAGALKNAKQAVLANMIAPIDEEFLSSKGLAKLADAQYYYPAKSVLLLDDLYYILLEKHKKENNLQDLTLADQLNQIQLESYYQKYLTTSAGLQSFYIEKYQKTWLRAVQTTKILERITNNSTLWSVAFNQLQLLKGMELSYAQKNGKQLWKSNLSVSGLAKIFKQFYIAEAQPKTIAEIRNSIDGQTAVLDYYKIDNQYKLFYIDHKTVGIYEGYLDNKKLENYITSLNRLLKQPVADSLDKSYTEAAYQLYKILLEAIVQESGGMQHYVICPHQDLGHIPFEVLLMEQADTNATYDSLKYVVKNYAISYSYASTMLNDTATLLKLTDLADHAISSSYKTYRKQGETSAKALQKAKKTYIETTQDANPAQWGSWLKLGYQEKVTKSEEGSSVFPFLLGLMFLGFVTYKAQKK